MTTARIVGLVLGRIPAAVGQVEPAHKRQCVVDDHDFLVMRTADGMRAVELEMDAAVRAPTELVARQDLAVRRIQHGEVPVQDVDAQLARSLGQRIQEIAERLWQAHKRAERADLPYLIVSSTHAENLRFPNGHPLGNVVYVGDPGVAGNYYPVASFHRVLFEGKVAEALRLLRNLGAEEISIEYLQGFDRSAGVDLSIAGPAQAAGEIAGSVNRTIKASSGAKVTMRLSPTTVAQIPNDLIWFHSEPFWREVASARLESDLQAFAFEVNYTDDFGVNASLEAKISKVGLGLGGAFTDFRETVWKLSGTFADQ